MTQEIGEAAAAAMAEGERAVTSLAEVHGRLWPCCGRVEPFVQAGKYVAGLIE